jgi:hypothetical protein
MRSVPDQRWHHLKGLPKAKCRSRSPPKFVAISRQNTTKQLLRQEMALIGRGTISIFTSELERLGYAIALGHEPALKRDRRLREVPLKIVFAFSNVPPPVEGHSPARLHQNEGDRHDAQAYQFHLGLTERSV